jgi:hypothetical protein
MKRISILLLLLGISIPSYTQKKVESDNTRNNTQDTKITPGASGVRRSIGYKFNLAVADSDPGSGIFRYNNSIVSKVTWIYVDNIDISGEDQTKWYNTWNDTTGATARGSINIVENEGKNVNALNVTGVFIKEPGYWKIPVEYISGDLPAEGGIYYYVFNRIAHKKPQAPSEPPKPLPEVQPQPAPEGQPEQAPEPQPVPEAQPVPQQQPAQEVQLQPAPEPVAAPVSQNVSEPQVIQEPVAEKKPEPLPEEPIAPQKEQKPPEAQTTQNTQATQTRQTTQYAEARRPVKTTQTAQTTQATKPAQTTEAPKTTQPAQTTQTKPATQTTVPAQQPAAPQAQPKQPVQTTQQYQPVPYNEVSPVNKPATVSNPYENLDLSGSGKRKCYRGIIEIGYAWGVGDYGINNFRFNFINGIMVGKVSSVGLGLGYRRYFEGLENYTDRKLYSPADQIPVFLDLRTSFTRKKVTPYLALGIGGSAGYLKVSSDSTTTRQEGLYFCPSGGIWFNISDRFALFGGIAFEMQRLEYILITDDSHFKRNTSSLSLNIGIAF